ncbi:MAG TPA: glycosyltransferase [Polyangiaceae bacterium]|nr:glycosyltransferase [Polyangiaceae bacterium]
MLLFLPWISHARLWARRLLVCVILGCQLRYAVWRTATVVSSFEISAWWFAAALFLIFESIAHFLSIRGTWLFATYRDRSAEADAYEGWWRSDGEVPLVDIFIATYNESRTVLERTVVGAKGVDYPNHRVWLLDDGRRPWLAEFAAEKGVGYITRADNAGYKAGNLNNAFRHVRQLPRQPDFVIVLDADFILLRQFLRRTLALMHDPRVGIVQTPQHFYNPDPFQYALRASAVWPDDQRAWFDARLPALDGRNGATCCGTSFLLRMKAFNELGSMPTESVSEDTLLSIKLRTMGWETVFLSENLSVGLAPEGIKEFLTQRARWCLGGLQIATNPEWGPRALVKGIWGYIAFLENFLKLSWYAAMRVVWAAVPIMFLYFGFALLRTTPAELISFLGPFALARLGLSWLTRGALLPLVTDAASVILCPVLLRATYRVLTRSPKQGFDVTDKGVSRGQTVVHWRVMRLPLALLTLLVGGLVYSSLDAASPLRIGSLSVVMLFWTCSTALQLYAAIVPCIEKPKYRTAERYAADEAVDFRTSLASAVASARAQDISEGGALLRGVSGVNLQSTIDLRIDEVGWIRARVVRLVRADVLGVRLDLDDDQREAMIRKIYCRGSYVRVVPRWSFGGSFVSLIRSLGFN